MPEKPPSVIDIRSVTSSQSGRSRGSQRSKWSSNL